jgi:hypothetical protein
MVTLARAGSAAQTLLALTLLALLSKIVLQKPISWILEWPGISMFVLRGGPFSWHDSA